MAISLVFKDNGSLHHDLVLSVGGQDFVCDTYYLALDQSISADREDAGKVRMVLARLLIQWLDSLNKIPDGGTVYLPYDFSDQCTGWLECRRAGSDVSVSRGWAVKEGWSLTPSALGELSTVPSGFRVNGPTIRTTVTELFESIRYSLARVDCSK